MEENEKFIAVLYEKIVYDVEKSMFIYKPIEVLQDCEIDFENDILTTKTGKSYLSMEDHVLAFSEENLCYGYPMSKDDLSTYCISGEDEEKEEQIKSYYEQLLETVVFGVYDNEKEKIKIILAPIDEIISLEDDNWYYDFEIEQNESETLVNIPFENIGELINEIDEKNYETVKNYLTNIKNVYDSAVGLEVENEPKEVKNEKVQTEKKSVKSVLEEIKPVLSQLNELVGLDNIKSEIEKLVKYLIFIEKTKGMIDVEKPNLNMLFTGNPGTGKTTVARIIGKLFYKMGYLKSDKFAEITPKDLIAEYVGQTAVKTSNFIKKNKGGVIFIDEAYVFSSKAQEFAQEAIVEIIKEMEKQETVFIFAGYKEEMKKFVKLNPGMTSRVGYFLHYDDYSVEQLYEMFENKVKKAKLKINPEIKEDIIDILNKVKNKKHFGNGRFIDKLFSKILLEHAINTQKYKSKMKLITIEKEDIKEDIVETLIHENSEDIFEKQDNKLEQLIDKYTDVKADGIFEELIQRTLYEKLYNSSYDNISNLIDNKMKQSIPHVLEDIEKNIDEDQKVKRKQKNPLGF